MAGKFTRKELQMARPIIENAINIALNDAFKQSITSHNTSECTNAVKNSTGSAFSCKYTVWFVRYSLYIV